jgi:hypothetical protein
MMRCFDVASEYHMVAMLFVGPTVHNLQSMEVAIATGPSKHLERTWNSNCAQSQQSRPFRNALPARRCSGMGLPQGRSATWGRYV